MRINITLPDYIVQDTDERAKSLGTSRSGYIAAALTHKAQYDDMMKNMPRMMEMVEQATQMAKAKGIMPTSCNDCENPCKDDEPDVKAICDHFTPRRK